jgi:UPF0271 protein
MALAGVMHAREPHIRARIARLRMDNPGLSPERLAQKLVGETRGRVATSGAISGATAIVPGVGTLLAVGTVAGQSIYALEQETELVMGVAMVFGHDLQGSDERLVEALVVMGLAGGAIKLRDDLLVAGGQRVTVAALRRLPLMFLSRAGGHTLTRLLGGAAARSVARVAPLAVGVAAGAGFDYVAVTLLGRAAIRYYGPRGPVAALPPHIGDSPDTESTG